MWKSSAVMLNLGQIAIDSSETTQGKRCPRCAQERPLSEFPTRKPGKPRPSSYCKPCQRFYSREHYLRNFAEHNRRRRLNTRRYARRNRQLIWAFFAEHPCVDCGENDPVVLEFDHVTDTKLGDVSTMAGRGFSWKRVNTEISKCEVRCANCHRRRTAKQLWRNWPENIGR